MTHLPARMRVTLRDHARQLGVNLREYFPKGDTHLGKYVNINQYIETNGKIDLLSVP